jgi:hypothetical protein
MPEGKYSTAVFPKLFTFREVGMQVSLVTMSRPTLRTVAPPPVYLLDIKDWLKEDMGFLMEGALMGERIEWWAAFENAAAAAELCYRVKGTWDSASLHRELYT